jgi:site-specific recombinase XerD
MEVDDGKNPHKRPIPRISFAEFAPEYLRDKALSQKSFDRTERIIKQLVTDLGHIYMNDFTYARVQDWRNTRRERGNSEGTVCRSLAVLKNMFTIAKKRRYGLCSTRAR